MKIQAGARTHAIDIHRLTPKEALSDCGRQVPAGKVQQPATARVDLLGDRSVLQRLDGIPAEEDWDARYASGQLLDVGVEPACCPLCTLVQYLQSRREEEDAWPMV